VQTRLHNQPIRQRIRSTVWLALALLATAQLTFAAHQFDHAAGDPTQHCQTCSQLQRFDDVVVDLPVIAFASAATSNPSESAPPVVVDPAVARAFDSRAPPLL